MSFFEDTSSRMMTLADSAAKLKQRKQRGFSLPTCWLMTDERLKDPLAVVRRMPAGAAVIVRGRSEDDMRATLAAVLPAARARRVAVVVAGAWRMAAQARLCGVHLPESRACGGRLAPLLGWWRQQPKGRRLLTVACHGRRGLAVAAALGASAATLSPLFPTRSHPGQPTLGITRAALLGRQSQGVALIALGGVTARRCVALKGRGFTAVAAIDGWNAQIDQGKS